MGRNNRTPVIIMKNRPTFAPVVLMSLYSPFPADKRAEFIANARDIDIK